MLKYTPTKEDIDFVKDTAKEMGCIELNAVETWRAVGEGCLWDDELFYQALKRHYENKE